MSALVERARAIAARVHAGDVDQVGRPYLEHLEHVRAAVAAALPDDEMLQVAALLHDAVEDHPEDVSWESLRAEGIPDDALSLIEAVSRRPGEQYGAFIDRAMVIPRAALLKRADMGHNFLPQRAAVLAERHPEKAASLAKRYSKHLARLDERLRRDEDLQAALERLRAFEASL